MDFLNTVRNFAIEAHGDQKYGVDKPYVVHLDDVAKVLRSFKYCDQTILEAAYLHDVHEDCAGYTSERITREFSAYVARIVDFCTDEPGHNRETRKALTYARMRAAIDAYDILPPWLKDAIRTKVADRLANVLASARGDKVELLQMYRKERYTFRDALYSPGVCDDMWDFYDEILT